MRVAHLIMVHKNPEQVFRLANALNHPQCDVYLHVDKKIDSTPFNAIAKTDRVYFIKNRVECNWGGFSFVKAIVSSLKEIVNKDIDYGVVNLLSGQDYPLKSSDHIYKYFCDNSTSCFISYEEYNDDQWWIEAVTRYEKYHLTDIKVKGRYFVQSIMNSLLPKRKFPVKAELYGSANASWWTLSMECVVFILDYLEANPKLLKFMKYTWGGDEFLFPTIIMNSKFKNVARNGNLRHIVWEKGKVNPKILKSNDLNSLTNSKHMFARKFDSLIDSKIIDDLDKNIIMKDTCYNE